MSIDALRKWLLADLGLAFRKDHADIVARFERERPEGLDVWSQRLNFPPMEPWNSLLGGVTSVELGLIELRYVRDSIPRVQDGTALWFFQFMMPVAGYSCFERMEWLTKRASRGSSALIAKAMGDEIVGALTGFREHPKLEPLRHYGTHGPQLGLDGKGWLAEGATSRFWELMAVAGDDGSGVLEQFLGFSADRRARLHEATSQFVDTVERIIAEASDLLLNAFEEGRQHPKSLLT